MSGGTFDRGIKLFLLVFFAIAAVWGLLSLPSIDLRSIGTVWLKEPRKIGADGTHTQVKLPYFVARPDPGILQPIEFDILLEGPSELVLDQCRQQQAAASCVLLIQQVVNGGDYYLNGTWVAGLPKSNEYARRVWYRPLLVPLPSHLLKSDGTPNTVRVIQTTLEPFIQIPQIYVGAQGSATLIYEITYFLSSTLANSSNLFCIAAGIFLLGAWLASPKDTSFALAGGATIMWAALFTVALWPYVPMSLRGIWRWTVYTSEAGLILLMSLFVLSVAKVTLSNRTKWCVVAFGMVAPVTFAIVGSPAEYLLDRIWTGPMLLLYVYATYRLARYAIRHTDTAPRVLLAQSVVCCILGYHDYGVSTGALSVLSPDSVIWTWSSLFFEPIYLTHLCLPILLVVMGRILLGQYQRNVKRVLHANDHLSTVLAEREAELSEAYRAQRRSVRIEAAQRERDRIYQEIHDGIGSRLVTTLFTVRSGQTQGLEIEAQLLACLTDMRMIINTQQAMGEEIQAAVFTFCSDLEAQLERTSLRVFYDISDGPSIHLFPSAHLCLMRVLQEAVSNAIKHAHATELVVTLQQSDAELLLTLTDNGLGLRHLQANVPMAEPTAKGGMGLPGLAARAAALGGSCSVRNRGDQSGVVVELWLPVVSPGDGVQFSKFERWPLYSTHLQGASQAHPLPMRTLAGGAQNFLPADQIDSGLMPL